MDEPINIRIRGLIAMVFGLLLTFGLFWLSNVLEVFSYHFIALGPLVAAYGLGAAILGDRVFGLWSAQARRNTLYRWTFAAGGAIAGSFLAGALGHGEIHVFERTQQAGRERAGHQEHLVSRAELDDAIQEVATRAAELQRIRAGLNPGDAAAVQKFDQDVAAYTQRNHEVGELKAKYEARLGLETTLKTGLMGTWKSTYDVTDDDHPITVTLYLTYCSDGRARLEKAAYAEGRAFRANANGHWELTGNHLRVTTDTATKESGERAGHMHEYVLHEISAEAMHYLDVTSGAEIVCQRVAE